MAVYQSNKEIISFRSALILAVCISFGFMTISVLLSSGELKTAIGDAISVIVDVLAALGLLYAAKRSEICEKHVRLAWTVLFLGMLSQTVGDIVWTILEVGLHQEPFPSLADLWYVAQYPIFALGIFLLPRVPLTSGEKLKVFLDTGIVVIASSIFFWILLIAPTLESNKEADIYTLTLSVAYPVLDLLLLFALIELLFRRIKSTLLGPILLLVIGMAVMISTDVTFLGQSLRNAYVSGGLLDTGWLVAYSSIGLAGILQANSVKLDSSSQVLEPVNIQFTWPYYLPYIGAVAAYILLLWGHDHPLPLSFSYLSLGMGGIVGLIIIRQIAALKENESLYDESKRSGEAVRRLNEDLEKKITERTGQLESTNRELQNEIQERKIAEKSLRNSESKLASIIDFLPDATFVVDNEKRVIAWNRAIEEMTGIKSQDILGKGDYEYSLPFYGQRRPILIDLVLETKSEMEKEYSDLSRTDGTLVGYAYAPKLKGGGVYLWGAAAPIYDTHGKIVGSIESIKDITDRKQTEDRISASLKEKEVLLKEVHHRVKNNLGIISALLSLQSSYLTDENLIKIFRDSQNRIRSMALIHENLYRSKNLDKVDFNDYINQLVSLLSQSYDDLKDKIKFKVKSEKVYLNINTAIPCGMIINEIVSNSLKHAFPDGRSGEICVDLSSEDNGFKLVISDNGVGVKGDLNVKESKTLGFRLVDALVQQINGSISLNTINGVRCEIQFKESK